MRSAFHFRRGEADVLSTACEQKARALFEMPDVVCVVRAGLVSAGRKDGPVAYVRTMTGTRRRPSRPGGQHGRQAWPWCQAESLHGRDGQRDGQQRRDATVSYRIQLQNRLYSERGKAGRNVEQAKAFRAAEQLRNRQSKTRKKEETPAAQQRVQTERVDVIWTEAAPQCNLDPRRQQRHSPLKRRG